MNTIKKQFKTGIISTFFVGLMAGQTTWTKEFCDNFEKDPGPPFDGAWVKAFWAEGDWNTTEGQEGLEVRGYGDFNGDLFTKEIFVGDVTVWMRCSFLGNLSSTLGLDIHFDYDKITGYSANLNTWNNKELLLRKWDYGTLGWELKAPIAHIDFWNPDLILEIELKATRHDIEARVWAEGEDRPVEALVSKSDYTYRTGSAGFKHWGGNIARVYKFCATEDNPIPEELFIRGDVNSDNDINIADVINILSYLFAGGETPSCLDAADTNDDGAINIADSVLLLSHLFGDTGDLPMPFGKCGADPENPAYNDDLDCSEYTFCD